LGGAPGCWTGVPVCQPHRPSFGSHPFHPGLGLRAIGQNELDPQLLHRPPKLRLRRFPRQLFGDAGHPFATVDAVPVHIQAGGQALLSHPAFQHVVAGPCGLLLKEAGIQLVGHVVHHHHQRRAEVGVAFLSITGQRLSLLLEAEKRQC